MGVGAGMQGLLGACWLGMIRSDGVARGRTDRAATDARAAAGDWFSGWGSGRQGVCGDLRAGLGVGVTEHNDEAMGRTGQSAQLAATTTTMCAEGAACHEVEGKRDGAMGASGALLAIYTGDHEMAPQSLQNDGLQGRAGSSSARAKSTSTIASTTKNSSVILARYCRS